MRTLANVVLRWSWGALFLWFGSQQLLHASDWLGYLPEWTGYLPIPATMLIHLNGWMEICFAVALILGIFTRFVATVLALHLAGIAFSVGGATGVRDAALAAAGISIAIDGPDEWTLDKRCTS